jgi:hypothetical protein
MPHNVSGWLSDVIEHQHGVLSRMQAAQAGLTRHAIAAHLQSGRWRRMHPGVYASFSGGPPREAVLWAALLRVGHDGEPRHHAVLSHQTAAELWGLPTGNRQILVVRGRSRTYEDVRYQDYGTCVELDGAVAHPAGSRWRDTRRDNANAADGIITLRYGWTDVAYRPCAVAAEVARALQRRGWAGSLRRCGPGCSA